MPHQRVERGAGSVGALRVLVVVLVLVFAVEGVIMLVLPPISPWETGSLQNSLADATLLVLVTSPALWLVIVRPLRNLSASRGALLRHYYDAAEHERARLGRDLHDEVGQQFTALLVGLRGIEQAPTVEDARRWAREMHAAAAGGLEEVRRLARGLRPAVLEELGLAEAAGRLCEDTRQAHGMDVVLECGLPAGSRLDPRLEITVYRILQESLTNVVRHSQASRIDVRLGLIGGQLSLEVLDNGRGFDVRSGMRDRDSLGIQAMRERAAMLGGTLSIESTIGRGTSLRLMLDAE